MAWHNYGGVGIITLISPTSVLTQVYLNTVPRYLEAARFAVSVSPAVEFIEDSLHIEPFWSKTGQFTDTDSVLRLAFLRVLSVPRSMVVGESLPMFSFMVSKPIQMSLKDVVQRIFISNMNDLETNYLGAHGAYATLEYRFGVEPNFIL